jgi:hypothetical protein
MKTAIDQFASLVAAVLGVCILAAAVAWFVEFFSRWSAKDLVVFGFIAFAIVVILVFLRVAGDLPDIS